MKDAVDRLTPLGVMVLALLEEGDMHPYEMMRLLRQRRDDRLTSITNGTLYHTVSRLERCGLLAEVGVDREGNRPERTTYTVTDAGREAVPEWVRRELGRIDRPAEFRIAVSEAHNLPRDEVIDLLRRRRAAITGEHLLHREGLQSSRERGVSEQYLLEIEREERLLETELRWLDDLIQRLDAASFPWGAEDPTRTDHHHEPRKAARL